MGSLAELGERKKGGGRRGRWWDEKRELSILKIYLGRHFLTEKVEEQIK